jgi:prepilin-type processing-associated H-X9-DG protein
MAYARDTRALAGISRGIIAALACGLAQRGEAMVEAGVMARSMPKVCSIATTANATRTLTAGGRAAFTLVELLVVIGIIAALIGVLLPVLSGVSARGREIQCQSNLRQVVQLCLAYAAENKGQLPYGVYDAQWAGPGAWPNSLADDHRLITLWSIVSRMSSKRYNGDDIFTNADAPNNSAPFLRCPEAAQVMDHLCAYAGSMSAFISPTYDLSFIGSQPLIDKPTRVTQLLPFMALVWDTNVQPGMATDVGYVIGADIDGQRIWVSGASTPEHRFFLLNDPYGQIPPGTYGNSKPVRMDVAGFKWLNIDPRPLGSHGFNSYPYQGQLRFRHSKGTACNVAFADGSVGHFSGKFDKDGAPLRHDALRRSFMVKWPNGYGLIPTL